jgi:hypothetical protein
MRIRPLWFWLTGIAWIVASSLLGIALFIAMVLSVPMPGALRLLHVHGALVGGVAQIIMGAMLAFIPPLLLTGGTRPDSHPVLYFTINVAAVLLLTAFGLGHNTVIGVAGIFVLLGFLSLAGEGLRQARRSLNSPPLNLWFYGIALLALLIGLTLGIGMALRLVPFPIMGQTRLAHIHLNLLGFITLTIVGTMHNLFPTVLGTRLFSARLAWWTFLIMPLGLVTLVGGFLLSQVPIEIAGGAALLIGTLLYGVNIVRTWLHAGRPQHAAVDHLLVATFFLVIAVAAGMLVGINALWDTPPVPFGRLHLVGYTHLALVGFIVQTIIGAVSHLLPINVALHRVKSNKKRAAYLSGLTALMNRWAGVQVIGLNLGTVGLAGTAALVWYLPLNAWPVQAMASVSAGLLALALAVFAGKTVAVLSRQPAD